METHFTMTGSRESGSVCGSVSHQGRQVRLEAEACSDRSWRLRIIGNEGRVYEWRDSFDSVAEAIVTGLATLQAGMGEFCGDRENPEGRRSSVDADPRSNLWR